ncbi:MAG: cobaltochelatase subunit CobN [Rhodospirillaceae bacterium]|nr:cobaltochelatase subunit CobN [Rhodospirillaceae bacterium]
MHLLAAQPGEIIDGTEAVDLGQTPGDIIILCSSDTDMAALSAARSALNGATASPSFRLANITRLGHNMSVDVYVENIIAKAKLVIVRPLGGRAYWTYGVDEISAICNEKNIPLGFIPGDDQADAELQRLSTANAVDVHALWQYMVQGGPQNAKNFLARTAHMAGFNVEFNEPRALVPAGIYWPGTVAGELSLEQLQQNWREGMAVTPLVFYRALLLSGDLAPVDDMINALMDQGLNPLPVFVASLKDPVSLATLAGFLDQVDLNSEQTEMPLGAVVNLTAFASAKPGEQPSIQTPFEKHSLVVVQAILASEPLASWQSSTRGLSPRDIAMHASLPEVDGRIISRAIAFKSVSEFDKNCQCDVVRFESVPSRIDFVAKLAWRWAWLRTAPKWSKRIALVLANYPNRDGRLGNGVGLDTPNGAVMALRAMQEAGFEIEDIPKDGDELIARLKNGPTNAHDANKIAGAENIFSLESYDEFFNGLKPTVQNAITEKWGKPESDPFFISEKKSFAMPAYMLGDVAVCLQPARGYNIDPVKTYHDPDLVPPHGYLAFYAWLQKEFDADAIIHFGKHGNLEWLPGKALALSDECFSEIALGPTPNIYPFIVNDPGEGTQAKRRTSAVIIDHLTPPLARAESYGPLRDLEALVDEYFEASGSDPRRTKILKREILELSHVTGLAEDCKMVEGENDDASLQKLDSYLCELKEMQIRDGLHIFGQSPTGAQLDALIVALVRVARGSGISEQSILTALALDMGFVGFNPLNCEMGENWQGSKPEILKNLNQDNWRSNGDTVERLELLALELVAEKIKPQENWQNTTAVLGEIKTRIRPVVEISGQKEIEGIITALEGRFVKPGPSGAPTRGRPEVLPTGRNFYSVDIRAVPTKTAWELGWKSASILVENHFQQTGDWPTTMGLSCWGTSCMRTGGDDIAQALALMGVKPTWDSATGRVLGFEVMPASVLGRPRVDVTLRVSGFFRDAFPGLMDLFSAAAISVSGLDENESENPLAANVKNDVAALIAGGMDGEEAQRRASFRVFGSMPGAYGAGLQALMDEGGWETDADLSRAYVAWGGYAYGGGAAGEAQHGIFAKRLGKMQAVVHNQDNREHDLLDSDDYYQFEGGMTAAVRSLSGAQPVVWHVDHSRPETPKPRTLEDEIARVVRARVVNPKWIAGVMRHGYKGAFEMAATVDYMVSFAATTHAVKDHHFDVVYQAYIDDVDVRQFFETHNQDALEEMSKRLLDAMDRGLWKPKLNSAASELKKIINENRK